MENRALLLEKLRKEIKLNNIDAYILLMTSQSFSSFLLPEDNRIIFLTGFSGSFAEVLVTEKVAILWTDPRYYKLAEIQLKKPWCLMKMDHSNHTPTIENWISINMPKKSTIGYYSKCMPIVRLCTMHTICKSQCFFPLSTSLVDKIWDDKQQDPNHQTYILKFKDPLELYSSKLNKVCQIVRDLGCSGIILTNYEEIAWLLNLRGYDTKYNPIFKSNLVILFEDNKIDTILFSNKEKFKSEEVSKYLIDNNISIRAFDEIEVFMNSIKKQTFIIDPKTCDVYLLYILSEGNHKYEPLDNTLFRFKTIKTEYQIKGFKKVNKKDSLNFIKFEAWLEDELVTKKRNNISEKDAAKKLKEFLKKSPKFKGLSFPTVLGSGKHSSCIHYDYKIAPTYYIKENEFILIDFGCHHLNGTSDISRTLFHGRPNMFQANLYTSVLKGVLNVEISEFEKLNPFTAGELEGKSRQEINKLGLDFHHSPGHSVGYFLGVHENCGGINSQNDIGFDEGMVTTIEPGAYLENQFGMRIENLLVTRKKGNSNILSFENLTLIPYERNLINPSLLSIDEIKYINDYHSYIFQTFSPLLQDDPLTLAYLKSKCEVLKDGQEFQEKDNN